MENDLPKIAFDEHSPLGIEVMNFEQLRNKLLRSTDHNPFASHRIEFYLVLIVTKGTYKHLVDFKAYELVVGDALFVAKNQIHRFTDGLQDADGFGIVFSHLFVDKHYYLTEYYKFNWLFNYHIESPLVKQQQIAGEGLTDLASKLYEEFTYPNRFAKSEILASLLRVLLLKVERAKDQEVMPNIKGHWLDIFTAFVELLEVEYVNTRSSKAYATKLFVSYKLLNEIVKKLSGKTVKSFINDFVTLEIKRRLTSTSLSIKEISYTTGFDEPANMIKFFKKNAGLTPLKFRQL